MIDNTATCVLRELAAGGFRTKLLNGIFFSHPSQEIVNLEPDRSISLWMCQAAAQRIAFRPLSPMDNTKTVLLRILEFHPCLAAVESHRLELLVELNHVSDADGHFRIVTLADLHDLKNKSELRAIHYFSAGESLGTLSMFEYRLGPHGGEADISLSRLRVDRPGCSPLQKLLRSRNSIIFPQPVFLDQTNDKSTALVKAHFFAKRLIDFLRQRRNLAYFLYQLPK